MMKKWVSVFLSLILVFLCTIGFAEGAGFSETLTAMSAPVLEASSVIDGLMARSFDRGMMVGGSGQLTLDIDGEQFGLDAETCAALSEMLQNSTVTFGVGKIEDGLRFEGVLAYAAGDESEQLTAALNLTKNGFRLESDLFDGTVFDGTWKDVLLFAGMSEADVDEIFAALETDPQQLLDTFFEELSTAAETYLPLVEPYAQIISDFAANLPCELISDVVADDPFPAVEQEMTYTCTTKDIAKLFDALADRLAQDETLTPVLDALLENGTLNLTGFEGEAVTTTAELCEQLRMGAKAMADTDLAFALTIGASAESDDLYIILGASDETASVGCYFINAATENGTVLTLACFENEEDTTDGAALTFSYGAAENNAVMALSANADFDGHRFRADYDYDFAPSAITDENGSVFNGYVCTANMSMQENDASVANAVLKQSIGGRLTDEGGAQILERMTMTMHMDGASPEVTAELKMDAAPDGEDFVGQYIITESMEVVGLKQLGITIRLSAWTPKAADNANVISLGTVTDEQFNALLETVENTLENKFTRLFTMLPAMVQTAIVGE